jgi:hypothetical protein
VTDLGKTRWLMFEQGSSSVSLTLLVALIFWLAVIFCSFGPLAPRNATVGGDPLSLRAVDFSRDLPGSGDV